MNKATDSPAWRLGSVAHRYRYPPTRRWPPATVRQSQWQRLPAAGGEQEAVAEGPLARSPAMARLEAVFFLSREPQSTRRLAQLADLADGTEARSLVRKLNGLYDSAGCAFRAVEVAGGFQLMSRPKFAPWLRRLHATSEEVRLSAPAIETLAVVAYRQPVLRADVEAIRGVQCGEILRQLMERDLVRIAGRSEDLGRPFFYGTTKRFLQVFGLRHLDELPRAALVRPTPEEDNSHRSGDAVEEPSSQVDAGPSPSQAQAKESAT
jgi:segregation and condensation protein B